MHLTKFPHSTLYYVYITVLLAYQIHKMRTGIKKLLAEQEMKRVEIDQLRGLLATLSKEEEDNDNNATDNNGEENAHNKNNNTFSMTLAEKSADTWRQALLPPGEGPR